MDEQKKLVEENKQNSYHFNTFKWTFMFAYSFLTMQYKICIKKQVKYPEKTSLDYLFFIVLTCKFQLEYMFDATIHEPEGQMQEETQKPGWGKFVNPKAKEKNDENILICRCNF